MTSSSVADGRGESRLLVEVLGSGSAYPTAERDTASLLIGAPDGWTLIDCPGSVVHKLARRGLRPADLRRVILTHDHVDHVYGLPHLLHAMAIAGGDNALVVAAPSQCLETVRAMLAAHRLDRPDRPAAREIEVGLDGEFRIDDGGLTEIRFTPVEHSRDTVAVRFDAGEASVCVSSDTRPCARLSRLASGADLLFHDCGGPHRLRTGFGANHASAREAGQTAASANVGSLALLHLGVDEEVLVEECVREARDAFGGEVVAARDGDSWVLPRGN